MQGMVKMTVFAVGWLLLFMVHPSLQFDEEDILQAPQNVTVAIGDPPLDLVCRVRRDNVFMEIDGQLAGMDGNVDQELRRRGFMFMNQEQTPGVSTQLVMMELNEGNNNTRVACVATDNAGDTRRPNIFSPDAFITILSVTIAIEAEDIVVTEGEMREVCFFALQHFKRSIPVQIMYNDGTAIENVDYRATQTEVIISPESNFEGCFNLSIIDDDFYETEKVFFLTFNSTDVDAIIETSSASVVIQDEDNVIEAPQNVTVGVGDPPLELICRLRRDNVYMEIDDQIVGLGGADEFLRERGFMYMGQEHNLTFGFSTQRVVMELTEGNNNTKVACIGADNGNSEASRVDIITPDVFITIIGTISSPDVGVTQSTTALPPAGNSDSMVKVVPSSIGGAAVVAILMLTAH